MSDIKQELAMNMRYNVGIYQQMKRTNIWKRIWERLWKSLEETTRNLRQKVQLFLYA